jgi:hypothetical protein
MGETQKYDAVVWSKQDVVWKYSHEQSGTC